MSVANRWRATQAVGAMSVINNQRPRTIVRGRWHLKAVAASILFLGEVLQGLLHRFLDLSLLVGVDFRSIFCGVLEHVFEVFGIHVESSLSSLRELDLHVLKLSGDRAAEEE